MQINETIRDAEGCVWEIKGWIDISIEFGWPPVSVNHYDINMSGPCGEHHFVGLVGPNPNPPNEIIEGDLTDLETMRSLPLTTRSLTFIIHYLEESYDE